MHLGSSPLPVWPGFTSTALHLEQLDTRVCMCVCIDPHSDLGCLAVRWYAPPPPPRGQSNYPDRPLPVPMGHIAVFVLICPCIMLRSTGTHYDEHQLTRAHTPWLGSLSAHAQRHTTCLVAKLTCELRDWFQFETCAMWRLCKRVLANGWKHLVRAKQRVRRSGLMSAAPLSGGGGLFIYREEIDFNLPYAANCLCTFKKGHSVSSIHRALFAGRKSRRAREYSYFYALLKAATVWLGPLLLSLQRPPLCDSPGEPVQLVWELKGRRAEMMLVGKISDKAADETAVLCGERGAVSCNVLMLVPQLFAVSEARCWRRNAGWNWSICDAGYLNSKRFCWRDLWDNCYVRDNKYVPNHILPLVYFDAVHFNAVHLFCGALIVSHCQSCFYWNWRRLTLAATFFKYLQLVRSLTQLVLKNVLQQSVSHTLSRHTPQY